MEKDLEKYIKFLAFKSVQVVVQSRLGEKFKTASNPVSSNDWFNIFITDHADVLAETKKALNLSAGITTESITKHLPLCVEISLQTVDGDKMILEVWSLQLTTDQSDIQHKSAHAIYNRMGILLKSLISITRCTPAYKLSRRQSPDSYNIYYRIYVDEPQVNNLGEGYKKIQIGQLGTALGTLIMSVCFNTKMTISPQAASRNNEILLKSDHFLKDSSPKRCHHIKRNEKKIIDLDKPLKPGAFVDQTKIKQFKEEDFILPETPPFHWLLSRSNKSCEDECIDNMEVKTSSSKNNNNNNNNNNINHNNNNNNLNNNNNNLNNDNNTSNNNNINLINFELKDKKDYIITPTKSLLVSFEELKVTPSKLPPEDENLLKEIHFPFASSNTQMGDLAKFYRDCYHAPKLQSINLEEIASLDDVSKQLEEFETSLNDYESLVKSMECSVDSNSNS